MELFQAIKRRRSVRSFNNKDVEPIKIENIIKAAFWAPSSDRMKALNLFIIKEKDKIIPISQSTNNSSVIRAANTIILLGYDSTSGKNFEEDTAMAAMNIMLAATDQELESCYVQIKNETGAFGSAEEYIRKILNIPENIRILGAIAIGYTDQNNIMPHTESEIIRKNIHYNLYGIH